MRRQATAWKKVFTKDMFAKDIYDKRQLSKICNKLLKLNKKM